MTTRIMGWPCGGAPPSRRLSRRRPAARPERDAPCSAGEDAGAPPLRSCRAFLDRLHRQRDVERRAAAAVAGERAAEHLDALAHAGEAAAERLIAAAPVIDDGE